MLCDSSWMRRIARDGGPSLPSEEHTRGCRELPSRATCEEMRVAARVPWVVVRTSQAMPASLMEHMQEPASVQAPR